MADTNALDARVANLRKRGVSLPRNDYRARIAANGMHEMVREPGGLRRSLDESFVKMGRERPKQGNEAMIQEMKRNRMSKTATAVGGDVYSAIPRFYDPMEYWDLSGLPWNMADEGHRHKLHKWLRLFYATHYLVPILIDIFTRFPLVGMKLESKDKSLTKFYEDQFLETLNYPEFMVQLGREYWTVGEAFPLGSFDEDLGIWEREELLNPEDIVVDNFPLLGSQQLKVQPPEYLKKLVQEKNPAKEYKMLELNFPELIPYLRKNEKIPLSGVLLKQVANKITSWDDHGTPILLRGLRTLIHEEKLMASQDAIAERLYSPLILAKLGILDLGDGQGPWFPPPDALDAFRDDLDIALSSDFRVIVHHMGLEVENVFGREQMPRLGDDFDRIERRIMQIFGVNPSLLSAGSQSQPYASSALQAEFLNQILRTFQGYLKRHYKARALIVAEAQEHYDYELRGETRIPIKEEVVVYDEEGNKDIETRHKLLVPELEFETLDLRDESTERQFLQTLRAMGVPIPDQKLMVGMPYDIDDLVDEYNDELVKKTIKQQEAKVKAYAALKNANEPIPPDLAAEVEAAQNPAPPAPPGGGGLPGMPSGAGGPGGPPGMGGPTGGPGEGIVMPPVPPGIGGGGMLGPGGIGQGVPGGGPPAFGPATGPNPNVPAISMERRQGLPTPTGAVQGDPQWPDVCPICDRALGDSEICPSCGAERDNYVDPNTWHEDGLDNSEKTASVPNPDESDSQETSEKVEKLPRTSKREPKKYSILEDGAELDDEPETSEPESS